MSSKLPVSIFKDLIGPVMRGPSSSHCAAALRIGRLARLDPFDYRRPFLSIVGLTLSEVVGKDRRAERAGSQKFAKETKRVEAVLRRACFDPVRGVSVSRA